MNADSLFYVAARIPSRAPQCPHCGRGQASIQFGVHRLEEDGFTTSAYCKGCKLKESGNDPESLYLRWTLAVTQPTRSTEAVA